MPITPTNLSKNTISPTNPTKGYAKQAVYGIGIYGLCVYGIGTPGFGVVTNQTKNTISPTNASKS